METHLETTPAYVNMDSITKVYQHEICYNLSFLIEVNDQFNQLNIEIRLWYNSSYNDFQIVENKARKRNPETGHSSYKRLCESLK